MSWCDKLASTPTAGIKLEPHIVSGDALFDALSPVLNQHVVNGEVELTIERHESTNITFNTTEGYRYGVDPGSLHIAFNHRLKAAPTSGGLPELQMLSKPAPYTNLLTAACERVVEAAQLLPNVRHRKFTRVGIVTLTHVAPEDVPPGIQRFIDYVGRPWGGDVDHYQFSVSAGTGNGEGWHDSCLHQITKPLDQNELMTLNFDWGRTWADGKAITKANLETSFRDAQKAALTYFEELAEGSRFDEQLISSAAAQV